MIKYVFFDLDGTLIDSGMGVKNSFKYAMNQMNRRIEDESILDGFIGPPINESFSALLGDMNEDISYGVRLYREYYSKQGVYESQVYDGIPECLERLKENGIKMCVATSKLQKAAGDILNYHKIDYFFDKIEGSPNDSRICEKVEIINSLIQYCSIHDNDEVVMVGDRKYDLIGANNSGIRAIGVLYGYGSNEELISSKPGWIVKKPLEIVKVIENEIKADI